MKAIGQFAAHRPTTMPSSPFTAPLSRTILIYLPLDAFGSSITGIYIKIAQLPSATARDREDEEWKNLQCSLAGLDPTRMNGSEFVPPIFSGLQWL
ncbi:unnamed protein product [Cuscuta campestris]|uniref:Uncharacterized protein n=1 Tax=Cuscuta campestris TaxID=132261 RepID=A0A484LQ66_9ASTE|nr:unnamed protein product [Cuscuta campestris]